MINLAAAILLAVALINISSAQIPDKNIRSREQSWFGVFNQTRLSDRWGTSLDVQYRRTDNFADRAFQFNIRPGVIYYIQDNLRVSAGYALFQHFPARTSSITTLEHRLWQQILWNQKYSGFTTNQHVRIEQRFHERPISDVRGDGFNYNFRVRYSLGFTVSLEGKDIEAGDAFAVIVNELFLNFGDRITFNTFDQNRIFGGLGYQFRPRMNAQLGYMYIFQQDASGNNYWSTHAVRLFFVHTLDLRDRQN